MAITDLKIKTTALKIFKFVVMVGLALRNISNKKDQPGFQPQPNSGLGLELNLNPMDVNIGDYRLGPCDACHQPLPDSMPSQDSEVFYSLDPNNRKNVSVWGDQCLEAAQAAQNLLLLRMTNALVSDDWLCHFLNKAIPWH